MDHKIAETPTPNDLVADGLISFEQAEAIDGGGAAWPVHRIIEAVLYLGTAGFFIAAVYWYGDLIDPGYFSDITPWGAFVVALMAAAALSGIALVLKNEPGGIRRAVGVILALAVVLFSLAVVAAFIGIDFSGRWAGLVQNLVIAAAAYGAWWLRKSVPTEVALFIGAGSVLSAMINLIQEGRYNNGVFTPLSFDPGSVGGTSSGILIWLFGAAWIYLGYRRLLRSGNTAYLLGGATMVFSAMGLTAGVDRWWIVFMALTSLAVAVAGIHLRRTILILIGVSGVVIAVPIGLSGWLRELPELHTWAMIYGIPGVLLLVGAMIGANRIRDEDEPG